MADRSDNESYMRMVEERLAKQDEEIRRRKCPSGGTICALDCLRRSQCQKEADARG